MGLSILALTVSALFQNQLWSFWLWEPLPELLGCRATLLIAALGAEPCGGSGSPAGVLSPSDSKKSLFPRLGAKQHFGQRVPRTSPPLTEEHGRGAAARNRFCPRHQETGRGRRAVPCGPGGPSLPAQVTVIRGDRQTQAGLRQSL